MVNSVLTQLRNNLSNLVETVATMLSSMPNFSLMFAWEGLGWPVYLQPLSPWSLVRD